MTCTLPTSKKKKTFGVLEIQSPTVKYTFGIRVLLIVSFIFYLLMCYQITVISKWDDLLILAVAIFTEFKYFDNILFCIS